jgi:phospholipase/carboxylesterase
MDRIPLRKARQPSAVRPLVKVESALFSETSSSGSHAVFTPLHYESGYAYPLIVWLHGHGDTERQLTRVMPLVSMRNYVAAAPRGADVAGANGLTYGWPQSDDAIQYAQQQIFPAIETVEAKLHVNRRRVFLAGFGSGGTMAYRVAMTHPDRFAGVLSLCGPFPNDRTPLRNLVAARKMPVFLAVGRDDRSYPADQVCEDLRLFHAAGLLVTLRQYPCGDELAPQMLTDIDRWIIELISSVRCAETGANGR